MKLKPFAVVVKDGDSWAVQCADNSTEYSRRKCDALASAKEINRAVGTWLAKQRKKCPAKKAWEVQEKLKKFLGDHKYNPNPLPSLEGLETAKEKILSTLNAAERRLVEQRFGIKPKVEEVSGLGDFDEDKPRNDAIREYGRVKP